MFAAHRIPAGCGRGREAPASVRSNVTVGSVVVQALPYQGVVVAAHVGEKMVLDVKTLAGDALPEDSNYYFIIS